MENAKIFAEGLSKQGFGFSPLMLAQIHCDYGRNDCIECLNGCRVGSKQSTPWTILWDAHLTGNLVLVPEAPVEKITEHASGVQIILGNRSEVSLSAKRAVLASGAIGNSVMLLKSPLAEKLPHLGHGFFTHPQFMTLGNLTIGRSTPKEALCRLSSPMNRVSERVGLSLKTFLRLLLGLPCSSQVLVKSTQEPCKT